MKFLNQPPCFLFFTGKGGVGKTSIACASALQSAAAGRRVLLESTDTAPTGHTIRLLQLPGAWSSFLEAGKGDASCLGFVTPMMKLQDPQQTKVFVPLQADEPVGVGRLLELAGRVTAEA